MMYIYLQVKSDFSIFLTKWNYILYLQFNVFNKVIIQVHLKIFSYKDILYWRIIYGWSTKKCKKGDSGKQLNFVRGHLKSETLKNFISSLIVQFLEKFWLDDTKWLMKIMFYTPFFQDFYLENYSLFVYKKKLYI